MSFPRYPKYKDSGVNWLGEVPEHWETKLLKHIVSTPITDGPHETPEFPDEGIPFVSAEAVASGTIDFTRIRGFISPTDHLRYSEKYRPRQGDIFLVKSGATTGVSAIVETDIEFNIWSPLAAIRCGSKALPRFVLNFVRSRNFQEGVTLNWSFGTQQNIGMRVIENLAISVPPIAEQTRIAAFLDREVAKIDELVAEQRRLIELLKEKRQAVISHAVTKGLNPHTPMKASGIEWLGAVPKHWEITRLERVCSDINDINHEMPASVEDGIPFLSAKDLFDDGTLNFTTDIKMISEEDFAKLSKKICPRRGDIIYSRIGACLGKARLVETDERFLISYSCCVVRVIDKMACRRFIRHLLDGEMILTEARMRTQGIGVPDLGLGEIGRFPVPLPPMQEQGEIADYLDDQGGKLEKLICEAQHAIDLLQERRAALISAAVTGKIDVRGLVKTEAA